MPLTAVSAEASVSRSQANSKALSALGVKSGKAPVVVFGVGRPLGGGSTLAQAGEAAPPTPRTKLGTATTKAPNVLTVDRGRRAWAYYADWAPYQAYAHRGQLALVDAKTGAVRLSAFLTSPPVIDGRLPVFMRSSRAYRSASNRIFERGYAVADTAALQAAGRSAFNYKVERAPLADLGLARAAANQLAADRACVLRVSDTYGDFYDFTGADNTRARLGDLLYVLRQLNTGLVDERYSRSSGRSPLSQLANLIETKGCKDVFLYVAGRGFSKGGGTTIGVGTRVRGRSVTQQLVRATDLRTLIRANAGVQFSVQVDAPNAKAFATTIAGEPNVLVAASASGDDGVSFGYLPNVTKNGKVISDTGNPDALLSLTNRTVTGIQRFLTSADEVDGAIAARKAGTAPSFLAIMLGRAFQLGLQDDLPSLVGLQRPFFGGRSGNPQAPQKQPTSPPGQSNRAPLVNGTTVTTPEDTPVSLGVGAADPDGDGLALTITTPPAHGTAVVTGGLQVTYTPDPDYAGPDSFTWTVNDGHGHNPGHTVSIIVTGVNDAPRLTTSAGSATFTEPNPPVIGDPGLTAVDVDDTTLTGATVAISAGGSPDDLLAFTPQSGITGSYNAGTRTLTLTGSASPAAYQAALRSVTFAITGANPAGGARTLSYRASDAAGPSAAATRTVNVVTINDAPTLANTGGTRSYTENDAPLAIDGGFTISDPDSPTMAGATVAFSAGYVSAEDRLRFTDQNGITGTFDTGTGTLTLAGSASRADYETALRSVAYENLSEAPNTGTRTVTTLVNDGAANSNPVTDDIAITAVNDKPVVTPGTGSASYTENASPVVVAPALALSDPDSANLGGATVTFESGQPGDVLAATAQFGITVSSGPAGSLVLSGNATVAQYETVLRSVTFSTPSDDPSTTTRTIGFTVSDSAALASTLATRDVTVTAVNDAPTLNGSFALVTFTEDGTPVAVSADLAVADADDASLEGATIGITANKQPGDALSFTDQNGITGSYVAGTGTLTLSGTATVAQYQAALRSITFSSTEQGPASATRSIAFTVTDGDLASNIATVPANVQPVDDLPAVTTSGGSTAFTEGDSPVVIDAALTIADPDSTVFNGATVRFSAVPAGTESLNFVNQNGITGSYSPGAGVLTLTGSATAADYLAALRSVRFASTTTSAPSGTRTITFAVDGGPSGSKTIAYTAVNTAPTLANAGAAGAYSEGDAPLAAAPVVTANDVDDTNLESATVSITGGFDVGDVLGFTNQNGITGSYAAATGVLTLTGTATVAQYQTALRSVVYSTSTDNPAGGTRTFSLTVSDGDASSNTVTSQIGVTPVNDAPTATTTAGATSYTEGDAPVVVDSGLTVTDPDSANLSGALVSITPSPSAGDTLAFTSASGITGTYTPGTGILALSGSATLAQYQSVLRTVTYSSSATSLPSGTRTVSFQVLDSAALPGNVATKSIAYTAVNSAPNVTASAGTTSVTEGAAGAAIDAALTVTDSDDTNLSSASVTISAGRSSGDTLTFTNQNGISGSYDSLSGVLSLSGSSTVANYQTALRSVKFVNAGPAPTGGARTITFSATDPSTDSDSDTKAISLTLVDDAPSIATSGGSTAYTENAAAIAVDAALTLTDPDSAALASAEAKLTDGVAGDRLIVPAGYPVPGTLTVTGSGTSTISVSGSASPTAYRDLLRAISFESTSDDPTAATRHVQFKAADATTTVTASTDKAIAVTPVNDPPVAVTETFTTDEDTVKLGDVRSNDLDADHATSTLVVDQVNSAGSNVGAIVTTAKGAKVTIDAAGNLSYDPRGVFDALQVGDANETDSVTYRLKDPANDTSNTVTVNFTITPVNDAPQAVARTYNAVANAALELEGAGNGGVGAPKIRIDGDLVQGATDADDAVGSTPITDQTVATSGGGSVDLDADGTFVYTSEPGETASTDSFQFRINDPHGAFSLQTVSLNLKARIWFVDVDNAGAADGTSLKPFTTTQSAATAGSANDTIYVGESASQTPSAATLKNGQVLKGAGEALTANLGATGTPSGTVTLQAAGTRPVLSASSGAAVTLASGNAVRALNIDPSGTAKGIAATAAGTVDITDVAVNDQGTASTGTAVDLAGAAGSISNLDITTQNATGLKLSGSSVSTDAASSIAATGGPAIDSSGATAGTLAFGNVSSTNSTSTGIALGGKAQFSATGGSVTGAATIGVDVNGGDASIAYPGNITPASNATAARIQARTASTVNLSGNLTTTGSGTGVNVANNTGGTITFSGASKTLSSASSNAVSLSSNTGATVQFTGGGLAVTSTSGDAFRATGGGTVSVAGAANTLSAGTGAALHVDSVSTSGLTFQSINDTGGAEGIYLKSTGGGQSLTVTGDASTTRNTSGGTISNVTGADGAATGNAVYLDDTDGVSLEQMSLTGSQNNGLSVSNAAGVSFKHGSMSNNGNNEAGPYRESNVKITGSTGTLAFDNLALSTPQENNLYLTHNSGAATLNVTNSTLTMDPSRTGIQGDGVLVDGGDTGTLTANITDNTFTGAAGDHIDISPGGNGAKNATWTATIARNTATSTEGGSGDDLGGGFKLQPADFVGTLTYDVDTNTVRGTNNGASILVSQGTGSSNATGRIRNNVIGINGDAQSGSFFGQGINVDSGGTTGGSVSITNNQVYGFGASSGIQVRGQQGGVTTGGVNATISGNTVGTPFTDPLTPSFAGINISVGITASETGTSCVDILNNTLNGYFSGLGYFDVRVRQRQNTTLRLPGYAGSIYDQTAVGTYLAGRNTGGTVYSASTASTGGGFVGGAACSTP
jgi:hypothetical protein